MCILLAEDDEPTATFVVEGSSALGHRIEQVANGVDATGRLAAASFDVVMLDRLMPKGDGMSVLAAARQDGNAVPVLMLTALGALADRVEGPEAGADDYLVKPFAMEDLSARVAGPGRRAARLAEEVPTVRRSWDFLALDLLGHRASHRDRPGPLQPREFRLLDELIRAEEQVLTRTMLPLAV